MNQAVMFSSASDEWATPQELFDRLNKIFRFNLDAAATEESKLCRSYDEGYAEAKRVFDKE